MIGIKLESIIKITTQLTTEKKECDLQWDDNGAERQPLNIYNTIII